MTSKFQKYKKFVAMLLVVLIVGNIALGTLLTPKPVEAASWKSVAGTALGASLCLIPALGWTACIVAGSVFAASSILADAFFDANLAGATLGLFFYTIFEIIFEILRVIFSLVSQMLNYFIGFGIYGQAESSVVNGVAVTTMINPLNAPAIQTGWKIVRDISNIFFIFILLYISITTILGQNGPNTYKLLTQVVIAALLINFSLVIGRVVIDSSNILANEFLSQLSDKNSSLTSKIIGPTGLGDIFGGSPPEAIKGQGDNSYQSLAIMYAAIDFFLLIAIILFLYGGILFLIRYVALAIILVLSPVAFIGSIVPQTEKYAKEWWEKLFSQSFLAPVYLFFIYLSVIILNSNLVPAPSDPKTNMSNATIALINEKIVNQPSALYEFMRFALAMGFLISAGIAAKQLGGTTAKLATAATGAALGLGAAGVATAGQATIGRGAADVAKRYAGDKSFAGTMIHGAADSLSKSSFDFRNVAIPNAVPVIGGTKPGAYLAEKIEQATGINTGRPVDNTGYVQSQKTQTEAKRKAEAEKRGLSESKQNEDDLKAANKMPTGTPAEVAAKNAKLQEVLKRFSPDDIIKMKGEILDDVAGMLANLDGKGAKALEDRGDLTTAEKAEMQRAITSNRSNVSGNNYYKNQKAEEREKKTQEGASKLAERLQQAIAAGNPATAAAALSDPNVTPEMIAELDSVILTNDNIMKNLKANHLEAIAKANRLRHTDKVTIREEINRRGLPESKDYLAAGPGKKFWG